MAPLHYPLGIRCITFECPILRDSINAYPLWYELLLHALCEEAEIEQITVLTLYMGKVCFRELRTFFELKSSTPSRVQTFRLTIHGGLLDRFTRPYQPPSRFVRRWANSLRKCADVVILRIGTKCIRLDSSNSSWSHNTLNGLAQYCFRLFALHSYIFELSRCFAIASAWCFIVAAALLCSTWQARLPMFFCAVANMWCSFVGGRPILRDCRWFGCCLPSCCYLTSAVFDLFTRRRKIVLPQIRTMRV